MLEKNTKMWLGPDGLSELIRSKDGVGMAQKSAATEQKRLHQLRLKDGRTRWVDIDKVNEQQDRAKKARPAKAGPSDGQKKVTGVIPYKPTGSDGLTTDAAIKLLSAGGVGFGSYALTSAIFDSLTEGKKGTWKKVLSALLPLGVGGLGAWGGYELADHMTKKSQDLADQIDDITPEQLAEAVDLTAAGQDVYQRKERADQLGTWQKLIPSWLGGEGALGAVPEGALGGVLTWKGGKNLARWWNMLGDRIPRAADGSLDMSSLTPKQKAVLGSVMETMQREQQIRDWDAARQAQESGYYAAESAKALEERRKWKQQKAEIEAKDQSELAKWQDAHAKWQEAKTKHEQAEDQRKTEWEKYEQQLEDAAKRQIRAESSRSSRQRKELVKAVGQDQVDKIVENNTEALKRIPDGQFDPSASDIVRQIREVQGFGGRGNGGGKGGGTKPYVRKPFVRAPFTVPEPAKPTPTPIPKFVPYTRGTTPPEPTTARPTAPASGSAAELRALKRQTLGWGVPQLVLGTLMGADAIGSGREMARNIAAQSKAEKELKEDQELSGITSPNQPVEVQPPKPAPKAQANGTK